MPRLFADDRERVVTTTSIRAVDDLGKITLDETGGARRQLRLVQLLMVENHLNHGQFAS